MDPEPILGLARSMSWAAQQMQDKLLVLLSVGPTENVSISSNDPVQIAIVGANGSTIVLWAFATELALKALVVLETGNAPLQTHSLSRLFESLTPNTRASLESRYSVIRTEQQAWQSLPATSNELLGSHADDFVDWRYIYEKSGQATNQILGLKPSIRAILDEYAAVYTSREC